MAVLDDEYHRVRCPNVLTVLIAFIGVFDTAYLLAVWLAAEQCEVLVRPQTVVKEDSECQEEQNDDSDPPCRSFPQLLLVIL